MNSQGRQDHCGMKGQFSSFQVRLNVTLSVLQAHTIKSGTLKPHSCSAFFPIYLASLPPLLLQYLLINLLTKNAYFILFFQGILLKERDFLNIVCQNDGLMGKKKCTLRTIGLQPFTMKRNVTCYPTKISCLVYLLFTYLVTYLLFQEAFSQYLLCSRLPAKCCPRRQPQSASLSERYSHSLAKQM